MSKENEYSVIEDYLLSEYNAIKNGFTDDDTIICKHIGTFTQDILISFVSLIERYLVQNAEYKKIQNRLTYIIIECIQNIIYHSNKSLDNNQLAYIIVSKNSSGYTLHSANLLETKNIANLEEKLDEFLKTKNDVLSKLFTKKIQKPVINEEGHGGIGLLTMVDKSGKDFKYKITKFSDENSLFHIELTVKYKSFK